jgi:hypothetical protein
MRQWFSSFGADCSVGKKCRGKGGRIKLSGFKIPSDALNIYEVSDFQSILSNMMVIKAYYVGHLT